MWNKTWNLDTGLRYESSDTYHTTYFLIPSSFFCVKKNYHKEEGVFVPNHIKLYSATSAVTNDEIYEVGWNYGL